MTYYTEDPFTGWPDDVAELVRGHARSGAFDPPGPGVAPQPIKVQLGDNPDSYLAVTFEDGAVVIRNSNDPTGKAIQMGYGEWHAYTGSLRGDTPDGGQPEQPAKDTGRERSPGQVYPGRDHIAPEDTVGLHSEETDARISTPGDPDAPSGGVTSKPDRTDRGKTNRPS